MERRTTDKRWISNRYVAEILSSVSKRFRFPIFASAPQILETPQKSPVGFQLVFQTQG